MGFAAVNIGNTYIHVQFKNGLINGFIEDIKELILLLNKNNVNNIILILPYDNYTDCPQKENLLNLFSSKSINVIHVITEYEATASYFVNKGNKNKEYVFADFGATNISIVEICIQNGIFYLKSNLTFENYQLTGRKLLENLFFSDITTNTIKKIENDLFSVLQSNESFTGKLIRDTFNGNSHFLGQRLYDLFEQDLKDEKVLKKETLIKELLEYVIEHCNALFNSQEYQKDVDIIISGGFSVFPGLLEMIKLKFPSNNVIHDINIKLKGALNYDKITGALYPRTPEVRINSNGFSRLFVKPNKSLKDYFENTDLIKCFLPETALDSNIQFVIDNKNIAFDIAYSEIIGGKPNVQIGDKKFYHFKSRLKYNGCGELIFETITNNNQKTFILNKV